MRRNFVLIKEARQQWRSIVVWFDSVLPPEQFGERRLVGQGHLQDLQHFVGGALDLHSSAHDGDKAEGGHRDGQLDAHGVLGSAPELPDPEVLLQPFEKDLDLPPVPVESGHLQGGEREGVRQEREVPVLLRVVEPHKPKPAGELLRRGGLREQDFRIPQHVFRKPPTPFDAFELQVPLGADHKEGFCQADSPQLGEGVVATVENVVGPFLQRNRGHRPGIVDGGGGDMVEGRDLRLQVVKHMRLDSALAAAELRPWEDGETQGNGRRVEGENPAVQSRRIHVTDLPRVSHHGKGELLEDPEIPPLVGEGEGIAGNRAAPKAEMVAFRAVRLDDRDEVAEAVASAQLAEHQRQQLVPACEVLHIGITSVLPDKASEFEVVKMLCHLCENVFVLVHCSLRPGCKDTRSNRYARKSLRNPLIFS